MIIHVCFKSIPHMLQRLDGCCKGDETLGQGKGRDRDRERRMTGARREWRRGKERRAAGLTPGRSRDRIESQMARHGRWREMGREWSDAIHWSEI
jgi:hypothetical protein